MFGRIGLLAAIAIGLGTSAMADDGYRRDRYSSEDGRSSYRNREGRERDRHEWREREWRERRQWRERQERNRERLYRNQYEDRYSNGYSRDGYYDADGYWHPGY